MTISHDGGPKMAAQHHPPPEASPPVGDRMMDMFVEALSYNLARLSYAAGRVESLSGRILDGDGDGDAILPIDAVYQHGKPMPAGNLVARTTYQRAALEVIVSRIEHALDRIEKAV